MSGRRDEREEERVTRPSASESQTQWAAMGDDTCRQQGSAANSSAAKQGSAAISAGPLIEALP